MQSKYFRIICAGTAVLMAVLACSTADIPGGAKPATATGAPKPAATLTLTLTTLPSETLTPTLEITATITPTVGPSESATPDVVLGQVNKQTNCRTGPGAIYDLVATYSAKTNLQIVAQDLGGGYIFVQNPANPTEACWIPAGNITTTADLSALPAYTPLPSPTASPSFTIQYKNMDKCKSNLFTRFVVVNTGSVPFRSAYVKVTNTKSNEVTQQAVNAFDMTVGCIVAKNIAPLGPGQTGYLQSELFQKNPSGQKMHAVIQVCTEQALKGVCVTQTLDFIAK